MRASPTTVRFWKRVIAGVDALDPLDKGANMFEQTVINRMLRANQTAGAKLGFFPTQLVRGGAALGDHCLHLIRVHHCAGCGNGANKVASLERVARAAANHAHDDACIEEERMSKQYVSAEAFVGFASRASV
jgi:hypothetical protein